VGPAGAQPDCNGDRVLGSGRSAPERSFDASGRNPAAALFSVA